MSDAEPPAGPPAGPSDRELLAAHVAGDAAAFGEIVRRHRDRLWAVALRTLGDREEAADAVQDALVKAFRAAAGYRGDAEVTTWLHRIVVNACLDRARRSAARPTVPLPEHRDDPGSGSAQAAETSAGPDDLAEQADRRRDVLAALARLPVEQRAAVVLVDVEGYPVAEAAAILDVPVGTVKSRCSRGRDKLAALLADHAPDAGNQPSAGAVPPERDVTGPDRATNPSVEQADKKEQQS